MIVWFTVFSVHLLVLSSAFSFFLWTQARGKPSRWKHRIVEMGNDLGERYWLVEKRVLGIWIYDRDSDGPWRRDEHGARKFVKEVREAALRKRQRRLRVVTEEDLERMKKSERIGI